MKNYTKEYLIKISVESNQLEDKQTPVVREIVKTEDEFNDVSDVWDAINAAKEEFNHNSK